MIKVHKQSRTISKSPWMYFSYFVLLATFAIWLAFKISASNPNANFFNFLFFVPLLFAVLGYNSYGIWHICVVVFNFIERKSSRKASPPSDISQTFRFALLYTTCNDFEPEAVESYLNIQHENFHIFILDDSSNPSIKREIEELIGQYPHQLTLIRRGDRTSYKAGNINNAIKVIPEEFDYIVILDADESLPGHFLNKVENCLEHYPRAFFLQVAHKNNHFEYGSFVGDLAIISPTIWKYYQKYRNRFGLTPCLGHGVVIDLKKLKAIGGFPEIVSEDLALTIKARGQGFEGYFTDDIQAYESFPKSYCHYRQRFFRWVRADIECLLLKVFPFLKSNGVSWYEKTDLFLREFKLPLTTLILPGLLLYVLNYERYNVLRFNSFECIFLMVLGITPAIPFVIELRRKPLKFLNLVTKSTCVYLSFVANSLYALILTLLRKDVKFQVTGTKPSDAQRSKYIAYFHVDNLVTIILNFVSGTMFLLFAYYKHDYFLAALGSAFFLPFILKRFEWDSTIAQIWLHIPIVFILFATVLLFTGNTDQKLISFVLLGIPVILFS